MEAKSALGGWNERTKGLESALILGRQKNLDRGELSRISSGIDSEGLTVTLAVHELCV
jgi:hypothetical protein